MMMDDSHIAGLDASACTQLSLSTKRTAVRGLPVNSSHSQVVTRSSRHTVSSSPVNSSQVSK